MVNRLLRSRRQTFPERLRSTSDRLLRLALLAFWGSVALSLVSRVVDTVYIDLRELVRGVIMEERRHE